MQDLQLVLIGVGALAIIGLVIHGVWAGKRENQSRLRYTEMTSGKNNDDSIAVNEESDDPLSDADNPFKNSSLESSQTEINTLDSFETETEQSELELSTLEQLDAEQDPQLSIQTEEPFIKVHKSPLGISEAQQKANEAAKAYEQSKTEKEAQLDAEAEEKLKAQQLQVRIEAAQAKLAEEQARIEAEKARIEAEKAAEPNAVIFHVKAIGDGSFEGGALIACMKKYGLSFGKNDIFHCYENGDPQKTLFSIANMVAPGTFPSSPMADFDTKGILLFLMLPSDENTEQHFKHMLQTAQQIADDLGGHVLDDKRNLMTPNRLDKYRQQIRESLSPQA